MILIQARTTSKRFPNKVLEKIEGQSMIGWVYSRAIESGFKALVLSPFGDPIVKTLEAAGIPYQLGPEEDVLKRYAAAAKALNLPWVVRITGDCPLIDPAIICYLIFLGGGKGIDYASNCLVECTDGQEVEFFSRRLLERADLEATGSEREHVTTWMKKNQVKLEGEGFSFASYLSPLPIAPKMSVDTKKDLAHIKKITQEILGRKNLYV